MIAPLLAREFKGGLPAAAAIFAVLALYIVCIIYMFDPETSQMLEDLKSAMPELYDAFGMGHDTTTLTGFMLNYLYGFLLTLLPLVLVMLLVNRMVVKPIATGSLAYALASPHGRGSVLGSLAGAAAAVLAVVLAAVIASELGCGMVLYPDDLDAAALLRANAGLAALWLFMLGVCLLSATVFAKGPLALWAGGGFCLAEFLVQMVAQMGDDLADAQYATFFTLFDPYGLAAGESDAALAACALAAGGIALIAIAVAVFRRRDLAL